MEFQIRLEKNNRTSLPRQIVKAIQDAIFSQQLSAGCKLPPTREMAQRLQVSRMVVVEAYEMLAADGYIETIRGSGSFVSNKLKQSSLISKIFSEPKRRTDILPEKPFRIDFRPGLPALDQFLRKAWQKTLSKSLMQTDVSQLGYGPVEGLPKLRRLIAGYAARSRGLPIVPDQVIITVGAAQAFDLLLRSLAPINRVAVENPGSEPVFRLIHLGHIQAEAVEVDENGLCVDQIQNQPDAPKIVYVMPSHQYPTGWAMSLERRMQLLNWAQQNGSYILEDDYDSEFRFDRQPPIALAAMDSIQRVIYVGTFSKTMFPGLRLGFCILPENLIPGLLDLKWFSDRCVPIVEQIALADWIETGLLERHIRKMRHIYATRRESLIQALINNFGDKVQIEGVPAGVHTLVRLDLNRTETELVQRAFAAGIKVYPSSVCYFNGKSKETGIIFGFGNLPPEIIHEGIEILAKTWLK